MKKILFFAIIIIVNTSCAVNKMVNPSVKPAELTDVMYFEPYSYIYLIEKGNQGKLNDSLSLVTNLKLDSVIQNSIVMKVSGKLTIADTAEQIAESEVALLFQKIFQSKTLNGISVPPTLYSILKENQQRFAILVVSEGFGRRAGNYGSQAAKGVGVGILTLGMYAPVPIKSSLGMYVAILDAERNEIIYYSKTIPVEKSPTVRKTVYEQYHKLYSGYLGN